MEVNRKIVINQYADDSVMIVGSEQDLQTLLLKVSKEMLKIAWTEHIRNENVLTWTETVTSFKTPTFLP